MPVGSTGTAGDVPVAACVTPEAGAAVGILGGAELVIATKPFVLPEGALVLKAI